MSTVPCKMTAIHKKVTQEELRIAKTLQAEASKFLTLAKAEFDRQKLTSCCDGEMADQVYYLLDDVAITLSVAAELLCERNNVV